MSKEAMKLALEALEGNATNPVTDPEQAAIEDKAITALREALAEQPAQTATYTCGVSMQMEQPAVPQSWQPIDTAPRFGRILVTGTEIGTCVASAGWDNDTPEKIRWEVVNDIVVNPTHWMPLPATPKQGEQMSKEAMKLALEALDRLVDDEPAQQEPEYKGWYCAHCQRGVDGSEVTYHEQHTVCGRVITDDVPPKAQQQEPLFWYRPCSNGMYEGPIHNAQIERIRKESGAWHPLYTSPPASKPWVGLEPGEISKIATSDPLAWANLNTVENRQYFARAIEAKLKEKNA